MRKAESKKGKLLLPPAFVLIRPPEGIKMERRRRESGKKLTLKQIWLLFMILDLELQGGHIRYILSRKYVLA